MTAPPTNHGASLPSHGNPYAAPGGHPGTAEPGGLGSGQADYAYGERLPSAPPLGLGCRVCGAQPALDLAVRAHQALIFLMKFRKMDGPFCRTCGRALIRSMTTSTLWQGWWSPFSLALFAPFALISNLIAHIRLGRLPRPEPDAHRQQLDEGKPVVQRPLAYIALIPALWAVWAVAGIIAHTK
ncbi:hypothetical protein AB0M39_21630 [Streptomyces sp. NPDC051907]|uniref:hypothetical protein n=1 Tax=Streptomyces sp. NPDC051907 TaxID=3155284 RepID=UPI00341DEECF